jgi:hypothetical protein
MWWFIAGLFVGALFMGWVFADSIYEMESSLEYHKRHYRYTYKDISEAWGRGFDNKPPSPPEPNYDI